MGDLSIDFEWVDPEGARGPELRATWARLTVSVADTVVTRLFDARARSVRESVYLPLYPLAEWLALNWWRLLYEVHSPRLSAGNGYEPRHNLAAAREGFALPALSFEPMGERLRLHWTGNRLCRAPLEFISSGTAFVSRDSVREELTRFIDAVHRRLEDEEVPETVLGAEWRAIRELEPDEEDFCRLSAALGVDPFQAEEHLARRLIAIGDRIPIDLQEEFFSSTDISIIESEAEALEEAIAVASNTNSGLEALRQLRDRLQLYASPHGAPPWMALELPPWRQGYAAAQRVRDLLDLDGSPLPSFQGIGRALGVEGALLDAGTRTVRGLMTIDGVVGLDAQDRPGFAVRASTGEARRFGVCRELFEYLATGQARSSLITRGGTDRQQRNRAFAAEFLLPSRALRERVSAGAVTYQEVNEIADEFGVSWAVVSHQLENHQIARVTTD